MTLRGAVVGYGAIARNGHVPRWKQHEGAEIVALADTCFGAGEATVDGLRAFSDLDALLAARDLDLDFLDVCTPPSTHAEIVGRALERGLHVFCEKPLVVTRGDFDRVRAAAATSDRVLFTVHNWRHAPILEAMREILAAETLGTVREVTWTVERTGPSKIAGEGPNWRLDAAVAGGGILVDHGWHALYLVLEWLAEEPLRVMARLENRKYADLGVEDTAEARIETANAAATLFFTWAGMTRRNEAHVVGEAGRIDLLDDRLRIQVPGHEEERVFDGALSGGSSHPDWFDATAREFLDEVEGRAPRGRNLEAASRCFRVLEAAWLSAAEGGRAVAPRA